MVHGAELTAAPARRWKTQINENANVAAFASELPEANHNEIEGWEHAREHGPFSAVFLRLARPAPAGPAPDRAVLGGPGRPRRAGGPRALRAATARWQHVLSLVMLGDLVSVALAELGGVDAAAMEAIEGFKAKL